MSCVYGRGENLISNEYTFGTPLLAKTNISNVYGKKINKHVFYQKLTVIEGSRPVYSQCVVFLVTIQFQKMRIRFEFDAR